MHEPTQAAARRVDLAAPHTAVAMYPLVLAVKLGVYLVTGVLASMALAAVPLVRLLHTKERGPASAPRPGRWPRRSVAASTTPRTRGCAPSRLNRRRPPPAPI